MQTLVTQEKKFLAQNDVEFNSLEEMGTEHKELNLGDIMADAYVYAVENSEYYDGDPVDVAGCTEWDCTVTRIQRVILP